MALSEEQKLQADLAERWVFLKSAFSSSQAAPKIIKEMESEYHRANPTNTHEGPTMANVIAASLEMVDIDMNHLYSLIEQVGVNPKRYFEFLLQANTPKVFDSILKMQAAEPVNHVIRTTNKFEGLGIQDRQELAVIFGNSSFPALVLITTGAALALGAKRFKHEVVPHLSIMEKYNTPGFKPLNAVVKFISQEPNQTGGILLSEPIQSTTELPARIKLASGPRSNPNSLAHFLYTDNLAAFQYTRRCPFAGFFEQELSVIESGFDRQGTLNRFLNKITKPVRRQNQGKPK